MLKVAALVEMMPTETKDKVFMTNAERLDEDTCHEGYYPKEYGEEMDVGTVSGNATCYNCGGWEHVSRDGPTQKQGNGKGEPEK